MINEKQLNNEIYKDKMKKTDELLIELEDWDSFFDGSGLRGWWD